MPSAQPQPTTPATSTPTAPTTETGSVQILGCPGDATPDHPFTSAPVPQPTSEHKWDLRSDPNFQPVNGC